MAVKWKDPKSGKELTFLNPKEKGDKFFKEIRSGVRLTNDGEVKRDKNGNYAGLTDTQISFRNGYLQAQKDSRKAYNARKKKFGE